MSRWIDADAVIEKAHEIEDSGDTWSIESADEFEWALDDYAPTIEPKRGKWIDFKNGWKCSACGKWNNETSNFCPNCGADMREREGE